LLNNMADTVDIQIPSLGVKFQDYRMGIPGNSFTWGPKITSSKVDYFCFHHSVTPQTAKNDGDWRKECDYIARIHTEKRGWAGVGYRFIICSDGTVAYVGDLSHGGSAVLDNNDHIFSACLVGDFTKELPTSYQVWSAHRLARFFVEEQSSWPKLDSWENVIGHQDAKELFGIPGTACPGSAWKVPGDNLYTRIKQDNWHGYPEPSPPVEIPPELIPPEPPLPEPSDPCKKAIELAIAENDEKWQLHSESAKLALKQCTTDLKKKKKAIIKEMAFWEFFRLKYGG